jgi:GntR family transcriptional repressor for pyruvate dehydrogenase complex
MSDKSRANGKIVTAAATDDKTSAIRQIIEHIRVRGFQVGDRLPSLRELSQELNINRNAVRDAMIEAQTKGLVKVQPRSGVYLQSLDLGSFVDALSDTLETGLQQSDPNLMSLLEARCVIEMATVETAIARQRREDLHALREAIEELKHNLADRERRTAADEKFHLIIAEMAGNSVLTIMLRAVLALLRPFRDQQMLTLEDQKETVRQHERLYRYIVDGKIAAAKEEVRDQIMAYQETLLQLGNRD